MTRTGLTARGINATAFVPPYGTHNYGTVELAGYVQTKVAAGEIKNVNVSEGLVTGCPNKMANASLNSGLGSGWRTDAATNVVADDAGTGAPANPVNSVKLQAGTDNVHLFSPLVAVEPGTYTIESCLDIKNRTAGEVGWYIDEYDADGNWISGQWKLANTTTGVSDVDLTYSPSSDSVAKASVQVYVSGDSGVLAYVNDVRW